MKVTIKGILTENKERLYERIIPLLDKPPYIKTLISMGLNMTQVDDILKMLFQREGKRVIIEHNHVIDRMDLSQAEEEMELSGKYWTDTTVYRTNSFNGLDHPDEVYAENDIGRWILMDYDDEHNLVKFNMIHGGHWWRKEFGKRGELIKFWDSNGNKWEEGDPTEDYPITYNESIKDVSIKGVLNEGKERFYDRLIPILGKPPYVKRLISMGLDLSQVEDVLIRLFQKDNGGKVVVNHDSNVDLTTRYYDKPSNEGLSGKNWIQTDVWSDSNIHEHFYNEDKYGHWDKKEFDDRGNVIYYVNGNGYWWRKEYNDNDEVIKYSDSQGQDQWINESISDGGESKEKLYDKILPLMDKRPYGDTPFKMGFTKDMIIDIFKRKFGSNVTVKVGRDNTSVRVFEVVSGTQNDIYREIPGYNRLDDGSPIEPFWEEWKRQKEGEGEENISLWYVNSRGRKRYRNRQYEILRRTTHPYDSSDGTFIDAPIEVREDEFFNIDR